MNARIVVRATVFLLVLFVVLYVGMTNPHQIDFKFPLVLDKKVTQPAALIFFVMFALGVIAGLVLNGGGSAPKGGESAGRSRK